MSNNNFLNKSSNNKNFIKDKRCEKKSCDKIGLYKAPISRDNLKKYIWFCLDHIKEYNKSWNYYEGLNSDEIELEIRQSTTWERPSWPTRKGLHAQWDNIKINTERFNGLFGKENLKNINSGFSKVELEAFKQLSLEPTFDTKIIKQTYKNLAKKYHPDNNHGNKDCEDKLKVINKAYAELKKLIS